MSLIQFVTQKNEDNGYRVIGVRDCNVSDQAIISEHETLTEAHRTWRNLSMIFNSPFSNQTAEIFERAIAEGRGYGALHGRPTLS